MQSNKTATRVRTWQQVALGLALGLTVASGATAQDASHPLVAGYGAVGPAKDVANPPDPSLHYRVAFEVTRAATDSSQINPALDRVARFVNLLGASGIHPAPGDIVIVIHGPATPSIASDAGYQTRFHQSNPNTPLIAALRHAGVEIHVCSYALANAKIEREAVASDVTIDQAAVITLANLQLKGWLLMPG
jgi:intracellular sulfur oxidation DsrE/DsrF family protein